MKTVVCFTLVFFALWLSSFSQVGGTYTYAFLNLTNSARIAALGGKQVSIQDDDLNLPFHNPSLLSDSMHNHLVFNYVNYFSDINYGYISYARSYGRFGTFAAGIHYLNYGTFTGATEAAVTTGNFYAAEYAFNLIWSKPLDSLFTFGINLKPVYSVLEHYQSFGLVADAGITYNNRKHLVTAALVLKNVGMQIVPYYSGGDEPVPYEIQFGATKRLRHAPLRFSLLIQHLETPDMSYRNPNEIETDPITEEEIQDSRFKRISDNMLRHLIIGSEILITKNMYLCAGYNFQRRKEMRLDTHPGITGASFGCGFKVSKFRFSYGRAMYHIAGASNHFSLCVNLSDFIKKTTL